MKKTYEQGYINGFAQSKKKIEELENNWNELKKYIGIEWYSYDNDSVEFEVAKCILDKMKEIEKINNLKENDKI